jgi:HPt (histidine-containing phosphotransfer) domain-containing protein
MEKTDFTDPAILYKLEKLGGKSLVAKLFDSFLDHTPERVSACLAGIAAGDLSAVGMAVHSLKSSAGNLGAVGLLALCERMEIMSAEGDIAGVASLGGDLEAAYARTVELFVVEKRQWAE